MSSKHNILSVLKGAVETVLGGIFIDWGATVPADASTGYAKGCLFIDTANGVLYINVGTTASSNFDAV